LPSNNTSVRELIVCSTRRVIDAAQHVKLNSERIGEFAKGIPKSLSRLPAWDRERHFCDDIERTAQWLFVLDALNFSFWPEKGKKRWTVLWNGEPVKGYWALACSLNLAMKKGIPITEAKFLEKVDAKVLLEILDGTGDIPMIHERVKVLNEIGAVLQRKYDGSFINLLKQTGPSVENVVCLVVNDFPCFNDVASYAGEPVYFFKRAQILCSDLWGAFAGTGTGGFKDMEKLTAFADYKLPQVLRALGILEYDSELAGKVDSFEALPSGSPEEIEIRSATVCAVEELALSLASQGGELLAFAIDWWLWEMSHDPSYEQRPHHRTRTVFY